MKTYTTSQSFRKSILVARKVPHSPWSSQLACINTISLVLQRVAGKDASKQFWKYHNESILKKYKGQLQVGSLDSKKATPTPPATPPPAEQKDKVKPQAESGAVAPVPSKGAEEVKEALDPYGSIIPYSDPSWYHSVSISQIYPSCLLIKIL